MSARYFTNGDGFTDQTAYLTHGPEGSFIVSKTGEVRQALSLIGGRLPIERWEDYVRDGVWKEITHDEAQALLDTTSTEFRPTRGTHVSTETPKTQATSMARCMILPPASTR